MVGRIARALSGGFIGGRKAADEAGFMVQGGPGQPQWTPRQYAPMATEGYAKCVIAYAAINEVSQNASQVPWILKRGKTTVDNHPLLDLLDAPNPWSSGADLIEALISYRLISGNAYVESVGPGPGAPPLELWWPRPDLMKVIPGPMGTPIAWLWQYQGKEMRWAMDPIDGTGPILQWKTFNPLNPWYGQSPIEAAAMAVDTHNSSTAWNKHLLDNGAAPPGMFAYKAPAGSPARMSDEQWARFKAEIKAKFQGAKNAGTPMVGDGYFEYQSFGLSPKDMDWIEGKAMTAREIALAFRVPPMLLGIPGDNTFSNYQEARLSLWENSVLPLMGNLAGALNRWLVPRFGKNLKLELDLDAIPALVERRYQRYATVQAATFMSTDEKRDAVGLEKLGTPEADAILIPSTMVPLEGILDPPEPPPGMDPSGDQGALDAQGNPIPPAPGATPPTGKPAAGKPKPGTATPPAAPKKGNPDAPAVKALALSLRATGISEATALELAIDANPKE